MKSCLERGETAAAGETAVVGVTTRARAASASMATSYDDSSSLPHHKIRKVSSSTTTACHVKQLRNRRRATAAPENSVSFPPEATIMTSSASATNCSTGEISSDFPAAASSCCSSNKDRFEITADPEVASLDTSPKCFDHCRARRERNSGESDGQESPPIHRPESKSTARIKMPSDSEIEEFFSVAEKDLHRRFSDKYNFDVKKDVPLEGRYEWVPIKP